MLLAGTVAVTLWLPPLHQSLGGLCLSRGLLHGRSHRSGVDRPGLTGGWTQAGHRGCMRHSLGRPCRHGMHQILRVHAPAHRLPLRCCSRRGRDRTTRVCQQGSRQCLGAGRSVQGMGSFCACNARHPSRITGGFCKHGAHETFVDGCHRGQWGSGGNPLRDVGPLLPRGRRGHARATRRPDSEPGGPHAAGLFFPVVHRARGEEAGHAEGVRRGMRAAGARTVPDAHRRACQAHFSTVSSPQLVPTGQQQHKSREGRASIGDPRRWQSGHKFPVH
mmetsp:Transcript_136892/g.381605  ORF Transcript_136892/g.381605 Transcript_136892/m.381605 type:complete len:276 (-) Transcript_136892:42-869(-)